MRYPADDDFERALHDLKGVTASPGFTQRVVAGMAQRQVRRRRKHQLMISAATVAILLTAASLLFVDTTESPTPAELASEAQLLRQEHARLRSELEALSASARETAPVLYLGGDDSLDLVLDLAPIIAHSAPAAATAAEATDPYEL